MQAQAKGLITPIFVGSSDRISKAAAEIGVDISNIEHHEVDDERGAAIKAAELARDGVGNGLMKGSIHSDVYMGAVLQKEMGLRGESRASHCFVMDVPNWSKPFIITDAALNIKNSLDVKAAITRNAIGFSRAMGVTEPKVAILSSTEVPMPELPSATDAVELAKLSKDGEFGDAIVDGPFALDNAMSKYSAKLKGITSPVAGDADILVVPSIEAGNIFFKALTVLGGAETAGLVVGLKVPAVLTSRADSAEAKLVSCALAVLYQAQMNAL